MCSPGIGAVKHQCLRSLRVGGGEQDAHRPSFGAAEQRGTLGTGGIHHGADIVHPLFERRDAGHTIGEAGTALVEEDQPRERREATKEIRPLRHLPEQVDVGNEAGNKYEIERSAPDDLIGDPQLATPGISSFGRRHRLLPACSREGYIAVPSCATDFPYREASTAAGYNIAAPFAPS